MDREVFLSIHRHWIWANSVKEQFRVALGHRHLEDQDLENFFIRPAGTYMCVWYGLLFAVCEALRQQGVVIPEAQDEINAVYNSLKRCRNAVFHVQPKYWSRKLLDFIVVEENASKVHRIHNGIGKWLLREANLHRK